MNQNSLTNTLHDQEIKQKKEQISKKEKRNKVGAVKTKIALQCRIFCMMVCILKVLKVEFCWMDLIPCGKPNRHAFVGSHVVGECIATCLFKVLAGRVLASQLHMGSRDLVKKYLYHRQCYKYLITISLLACLLPFFLRKYFFCD